MVPITCTNGRIFIKFIGFVGDLEDEDEVLSWLNEDSTLEIPGKIEEVNTKMLDKILNEDEHVVVFFCEFYLCILIFHAFTNTALHHSNEQLNARVPIHS